MSVIYEPKGKAKEYCPLAVNLYQGCGHGCVYCYAPGATRSSREDFACPKPRKDIIQRLAMEVDNNGFHMFPEERTILLSFTSDAYQPLETTAGITRKAIKILHRGGYPVTVLTKGGSRAKQDFDLMGPKDTHAASLTLLNNVASLEWEPGAALPFDRILTLEKAHKLGMKTWVSLEPVLDPQAVYEIIAQTHEFVDMYKVGVLNYHPHAKTIDWTAFAYKVIEVLGKHGCKYYLKEDLRKWLRQEPASKLT